MNISRQYVVQNDFGNSSWDVGDDLKFDFEEGDSPSEQRAWKAAKAHVEYLKGMGEEDDDVTYSIVSRTVMDSVME